MYRYERTHTFIMVIVNQISMNVMMTMVAVATIATTLKGALNVPVMMATKWTVVEEIVWVSIIKRIHYWHYIILIRYQ